MKIRDALGGLEPIFSFEFFPPKDAEGVDRLFRTISELRPYEPTFVSVTYGAMGSTRGLTVDLVRRIKREVGIEAMAHLTCVGATREEIDVVLAELEASSIENVLALRGDPPQGETRFVPPEGGFAYASELVAFIRQRYDFCLAGACYPEKHPEAESLEADLEHLKIKVDAGVDFLITQLFFDNDDYFSFVERARRIGIQCPIVAGIMPITNVGQIKRFTEKIGARIPKQLLARLEKVDGDPQAVRAVGVDHATRQCRALLEQGAPGIHFYTLNHSTATREVLENLRSLGVAPPSSSERAGGVSSGAAVGSTS